MKRKENRYICKYMAVFLYAIGNCILLHKKGNTTLYESIKGYKEKTK